MSEENKTFWEYMALARDKEAAGEVKQAEQYYETALKAAEAAAERAKSAPAEDVTSAESRAAAGFGGSGAAEGEPAASSADSGLAGDDEAAVAEVERLFEPQIQLWTAVTCLGLFYRRHRLYLKAERIARRQVRDFPDGYQGYHLLYLVLKEKQRYKEMEQLMTEIEPKFGEQPQYQIDRLAGLEAAGQYTRVRQEIMGNKKLEEIIPEIVLQKRAQYLARRRDEKELAGVLAQLAGRYGETDAGYAMLFAAMAGQNYENAYKAANYLIWRESEEKSERYYLMLYIQIMNLYNYCGRRPDQKALELMKGMEREVRSWWKENPPQNKQAEELLDQIMKEAEEQHGDE